MEGLLKEPHDAEMHALFDRLDAERKGFDLSTNPTESTLDAIADRKWSIWEYLGDNLYACIDDNRNWYLVKGNHLNQDAWAVPVNPLAEEEEEDECLLD